VQIIENWRQSSPDYVANYKRRQPHCVTLHKIHGGSRTVTSFFASAFNDLVNKTTTEQKQ